MSYGYNRARNRAASAVLVWCVGALHASPVIYAAKMDSTPFVFMTVESAQSWDMRDILQDAGALFPALKPISKYIRKIVDGEDVPLAVRQAMLAANTGKPGPAVLHLTHTAMLQPTTIKSEKLELPSRPAARQRDVERALELLRAAERPVILTGAGVHQSQATAELRAFAEASGIPVVSSGIGGRGVLPDDHPMYAGGLGLMSAGVSGAPIADDADLWLALGYSFSQTATFSWTTPKPATVIHVDIEETHVPPRPIRE
jgi:acetolactate synthase-1/2/3 large subunit